MRSGRAVPEYPLGAFMVGTRGQAMPMFRLSVPAGQPKGLDWASLRPLLPGGKTV